MEAAVFVCESSAQSSVSEPWRLWRAAAVAESRALRLLGRPTRCRPLDLDAVLDDAEYLEMRAAESERARNYRARKRSDVTSSS